MNKCGLWFDLACNAHQTPVGHPERTERLTAIAEALEAAQLPSRCAPIPAAPATDEMLTRVHKLAYIQRLKAACAAQQPMIDSADCPLHSETERIARLVSGTTVNAALAIMAGDLLKAFIAGRPPGHHAEVEEAKGFCYYNHVAVAARAVQAAHPNTRIAIFDFDVHHGNGTQHCFEEDPSVLFVSTHGHPATLFPGTGYPEETGRGAGGEATLNLPLPENCPDDVYLSLVRTQVFPKLREFDPQLLILSAGFDAHGDDPLGNVSLTDAAFETLTVQICELAVELCQGRVLSVLEGGYNLGVLKRCVTRHVELLAK